MDHDLHSARLPPSLRCPSTISYIDIGLFVVETLMLIGLGNLASAVLPALNGLGESLMYIAKDGITLVTPDMCIQPGAPASSGIVASAAPYSPMKSNSQNLAICETFVFVDSPDTTNIPGIVVSPT